MVRSGRGDGRAVPGDPGRRSPRHDGPPPPGLRRQRGLKRGPTRTITLSPRGQDRPGAFLPDDEERPMIGNWNTEAATMADYVSDNMFGAHRGAMTWKQEGVSVVFGN